MMKKHAIAAFICTLTASAAQAATLDLYVDKTTRQIYAEPGPNRDKLGSFQQVDGNAAVAPVVPAAPSTAAPPPAAAPSQKTASSDKKWYDRLSLRGYTQLRFDEGLQHNADELRAPGDRFIGDNQNLGIRRARVVLSGDVSDYLAVYIQPDFASTPSGSSTGNFGQIRDAYADIYFDKDREFRIRAGQSKMPYGWENLQSSQNRLTPDRADALNSGLRDERDLGLVFYYDPKPAAERFQYLVRSGLKGSGDYGVFGLGAYNGQGANRAEGNDSMHAIVHVTYPFKFANGQYFEAGIDAYSGRFKIGTSSISVNGSSFTPALDGRASGFKDQRVAAHFIYYPQPFGLQGEWTVGRGPELDLDARTVSVESLSGGYLQAMYRTSTPFGMMTPYVKWQTYDGASKFDANAPHMEVDETEAGLEWQFRPELELTVAYAHMERTNVGSAPYEVIDGDLLRLQLQWTY